MSSDKYLDVVGIHSLDVGCSNPRLIYKVPNTEEVSTLLSENERDCLQRLNISEKYKKIYLAPWLSIMKNFLWLLPTPTELNEWRIGGVFSSSAQFACEKTILHEFRCKDFINNNKDKSIISTSFFTYCFLKKVCELTIGVVVSSEEKEWNYMAIDLKEWLETGGLDELQLSTRNKEQQKINLGLGCFAGRLMPRQLLIDIREQRAYDLEYELLGVVFPQDCNSNFYKAYSA